MLTPQFWKDKTNVSTALLPLAAVFAFFARRRQAAASTRVSVPVICVGNVVTGGSGKTPVALAIGRLLKAQGKNAHFLSRGYKGRLKGPVQVDGARHTANDVGDEPLLLAEVLPTWVSRDRVAGAKAAINAGADAIIMDDGFQNPSLFKDISLLVIDGAYGYGNRRLLPAGPLREPVEDALKRASAVVLVGNDGHGILTDLPKDMPVQRARIEPLAAAQQLRGMQVLAFAGIARPRKFYRTLQELGASVRRMEAFPDHHAFTTGDISKLRAAAKELGAKLVTTEKDYIRLPEDARAEVLAVPIKAAFDDEATLLRLLLSAQAATGGTGAAS